MAYKITYKPFGKNAILIEWEAKIDAEILKNILLFKNKIEIIKGSFLTDLVVGYHSLTLRYKKETTSLLQEIEHLKSIYTSKNKVEKEVNYTWKIPVCYDTKFGIDLNEMSSKLNLPIETIIHLHTAQIYNVYFIGFLPGFLYLGGLDSKLFFDRKSNPRLNVSKGSVAIGGQQTGVYPSESAGGWNIIGNTPLPFFDLNNENPCFAKAGDCIQFYAISLDEFSLIEKKIAENNSIISKKELHD